MKLRQRKRGRTEIRDDVETISNSSLLVLYLMCVHHPYLFPLLRQLCKASRDDKELEIEFLKYSKGYKRSIDGLKYLIGRLVVYVDSLGTQTLMDHLIEIIAMILRYEVNEKQAEEKKSLITHLLMKMKENEKHKHAFEGRVSWNFHSLEKCTVALNWACWKGAPDIARMLLADPRVDPSVGH
jgi:hypothetical protein